MTKTLYVRIICTFLIIISVSLVSAFLIGMTLFKNEIDTVGQNDMITVGEDIIQLYEQTKPVDRESFLKSAVNISAHPIHMYDASGNVTVYRIDNDNTTYANISRDAVQQVLLGQYYRSPGGAKQTFIGLPFLLEGKQHAMFLQFSSENEQIINRLMLIILLLGLLIGSLCILGAATYLVKPLQALTIATKRLAKGDFDVKVKMKSADEIGVLTQGFNEMAIELKQLEQMRQDFVTNVSHEIQTPLTSISGFAIALKNSHLVAENKRNYYLDIIISESRRLSRLSDNLLKLASLDLDNHPFETSTFNLVEQIRQVIVTCEPQWSAKGIRIILDSIDEANIKADIDQLNQVWINLLGNSIKFTPDDGHIEIGINHLEDRICVTIVDSGIGISKEQIAYVFDRFYKTDPSRNRNISGNGLGLAIVKRIVALHHGDIEIKSELNEGTTVVVRLPIQ
ncbi:HAMP domain-containing protein [Paenibacillus sp. GSMTC-2017]|uniref:HAMP domain-containing sensor histidine kinase n=1 Tax=Paenibacillus sp. GSMTC-2017 TaxID=2794350 RepID=UPI0018D67918|nr:HAMP domain-containing sensor histidine kinase [Paenibacillus sp. GSMTC-2017]MBH5317851.1 HAMP domain-containing protein [Paenibacillus sp. GSMTC-2017]